MTAASAADVRVFPDLAALSRAAADLVVSAALRWVSSRGRFTLALSGGSTPRELYALLTREPWRGSLPWDRTHLFWADERCVPPDHQDSNYRLVLETLISAVPLPERNAHRIPAEKGPETAAACYEQELQAFFGRGLPELDLVLLGAGADGHTASLFPGGLQHADQGRAVLPVPAGSAQHSRVTLSLPVLNNAAMVVFLVAGGAKAGMVRRVLRERTDQLPAACVRPQRGDLVWMIDREAAAGLDPEVLPALPT